MNVCYLSGSQAAVQAGNHFIPCLNQKNQLKVELVQGLAQINQILLLLKIRRLSPKQFQFQRSLNRIAVLEKTPICLDFCFLVCPLTIIA